MHCALYARVSTQDQNCELQLRELRDYCTRRGWTVEAEYVDTGWSGAKASRPQLDRMMKAAGKHMFDCVLVWKLDRFGRSVHNLIQGIHDLASAGVRFISVTQGLDTDQANPTSRLLLHILAAVAEFERAMIQERVKAGVRAARARGVKMGAPMKVFDRSKVVVLHNRGMSMRKIGKKFGISQQTVFRLVSQNLTPPSHKSGAA